MEITERKRAEESLHRLNQKLRALSESNQILVHAQDEDELMEKVCQMLVGVGGYRLAWVGLAEDDEEKSVRPVAQMGFEADYLASINITYADTKHGRGPCVGG